MNFLSRKEVIACFTALGIELVFLGLAIPHITWFIGWRNNLTGGAFNISQAHAFCSNLYVQSITVPGSVQAQDCSAANHLFAFFCFVVAAGVASLASGLIIRGNRRHA